MATLGEFRIGNADFSSPSALIDSSAGDRLVAQIRIDNTSEDFPMWLHVSPNCGTALPTTQSQYFQLLPQKTIHFRALDRVKSSSQRGLIHRVLVANPFQDDVEGILYIVEV